MRFEDSFERAPSASTSCLDELGLESPKECDSMSATTGSSRTRTSSNRAGVTLMNNQVGHVVAEVMGAQGRRRGHRPPVDDPRRRRRQVRLRLRGDRRGARLGRLRQRRLRGDHVDALRAHGRARRPRPLVRQPRGRRRVHRLRPQTRSRKEGLMYEKDGEQYFIVDGHVHFWDAQPGEPEQQLRRGLHRLLLRLPPQPEPGGVRLAAREVRQLRRGDADARPVRGSATSTSRSSSRPT